MTINRLAKVGLFKRMEILYEDLYFEVHLHRTVLDRALVDMFSPYKDVRDDVFKWLDEDNDAFSFACERALLDPTLVFNTFKAVERILKNGRSTTYHTRK